MFTDSIICTPSLGNRYAYSGRRLLAEPEILDNGPVAIDLIRLEVVQEAPPHPDHLEQASPGVVILFVDPEMLRETLDAFGEERDLDLGRSRVVIVQAVLIDNGTLLILAERHSNLPTLFFHAAARVGTQKRAGEDKAPQNGKRSRIAPAKGALKTMGWPSPRVLPPGPRPERSGPLI